MFHGVYGSFNVLTVCVGDLAVLLGAGWPVRRLVLFSAVSALLGFVGLLTGSVLGHQSAQISPWILTLTAGVFLYVALADMVSH
jgi:zinc transporter ZupT